MRETSGKQETMTALQNLYRRYNEHIPLLMVLVFTALLVFFQAVRYTFPLGYAGMYALIAEGISEADFKLPMNIPHYGPGGIGLIYPPFAMYVFALAIKLGIPIWTYLKFAPAVFSLLAMVSLYYLTLELIESKAAGVIAVLLFLTTPVAYYTHVWSAGVVRGLALCFCLAGLFFYYRALRNVSWRNLLLAGFFLGLLLTTHWLYVVFAALAGLAFLIAERKLAQLPVSFGILVIALLVASPWLILIVQRHGVANIMMAYSSHGNVDFFRSLNDIPLALKFIMQNLENVTGNKFLAALTFPGLILLVVRRKFHLPLTFLFVLLMGTADIFIQIPAALMAGAFGAEIFRLAQKNMSSMNTTASRPLMPILAVITALSIALSSIQGLSQIIQYQPELDGNSLETASFVRDNTDPKATYLFVGKINEAEWFPYLLNRTPVFSLWGSEWKGTYAQQAEILIELRNCEIQKSWACMESLQQEHAVSPDLLVVPNKRWLILQLKDTKAWSIIYTGERYVVWERK